MHALHSLFIYSLVDIKPPKSNLAIEEKATKRLKKAEKKTSENMPKSNLKSGKNIEKKAPNTLAKVTKIFRKSDKMLKKRKFIMKLN